MHLSKVTLAVAATAGIASAAPVEKRAAYTDATILNYALTLEHLEDTFYREGLQRFSQDDFLLAGFSADVRAKILEVSSDETTHVSFLTTALKGMSLSVMQHLSLI